jgi:hypothetical protein
MTMPPNKPDAVNPAMPFLFHVYGHWRGASDVERWDEYE